MIRLSTLIVAICMVVIAASLGALALLVVGMTPAEAVMVALMALTGLAVINAIAGWRREYRDKRVHQELAALIAEISRQTADLSQHMTEQAGRLAALERGNDSVTDEIAAAMRPIRAEIVELGFLVQQLAEASVAHDAALRDPFAAHRAAALAGSRAMTAAEPLAVPAVAETLSVAADAPAAEEPDSLGAEAFMIGDEPEAEAAELEAEAFDAAAEADEPEIITSGPFQGMPREAVVSLVREAIDDSRIDLYLQPIVTLPQRKVRFYEAVMRLRMPDGTLIAAADFLSIAEAGGLMPGIDLSMVHRCSRVVRRLISKNRDVGVFCNLSGATLGDTDNFAQLMEYLRANRALGSALVFEMRHATLRATSEHENDGIAALAAAGFRLSIDHVADLRLELHHLAARGCRFIKIPASLLLAPGSAGGDIDPVDLPGLLGRFGIELIAEKIEQEATVVDLLDFDIKYAQGHLFSPPRPVRPEAMQAEPVAVPLPPPPVIADTRPAPRRPAAERSPAMAERISALTQMARRVARNVG